MDIFSHIINPYYRAEKGELIIGGNKITDIIRRYGTPLFIYDAAVMRKKLEILKNALPDFEIYYSLKANPNPEIIRLFSKQGCGIEIASGGELNTALKSGHPGNKIFFAGPGKQEKELIRAVEADVEEIHIESTREIRLLEKICKAKQKSQNVSIRINPGEIGMMGGMQMGGKPMAFGVEQDQLFEVLDQLFQTERLNFQGVHIYAGTQLLDWQVLKEIYNHALNLCNRIKKETRRPVKTMDFGGGFGVPYFPKETPLDIEKFGREIKPIVRELKKEHPNIRLVVEPGRYLTAEAGVYAASVVDIKNSGGKTFIILDGGMNHHLGASGNLGQIIKRNFPIVIATRLNKAPVNTAEITGPLCTPLDTLARKLKVPEIQPGDPVIILQSGAYGLSASPLNFLSHPWPPEILIDGENLTVIRERGTFMNALMGTELYKQLSTED